MGAEDVLDTFVLFVSRDRIERNGTEREERFRACF
jgi:hypothetical protein